MITLSFTSKIEDPKAFEALFCDYFRIVVRLTEKVGMSGLSAYELAAKTMVNIDQALPPKGRLLAAKSDDGKLMGCGIISLIKPDAVEMRRVFVRPEAQGQKLGLKIVQKLLTEAKSMGCTTLYADTVRGNTAMTNLCDFLGFEYIDRYPENANPPEFAPYWLYMRRDLVEWEPPQPD